jgi:hypothetical protein
MNEIASAVYAADQQSQENSPTDNNSDAVEDLQEADYEEVK